MCGYDCNMAVQRLAIISKCAVHSNFEELCLIIKLKLIIKIYSWSKINVLLVVYATKKCYKGEGCN